MINDEKKQLLADATTTTLATPTLASTPIEQRYRLLHHSMASMIIIEDIYKDGDHSCCIVPLYVVYNMADKL